MAQRSVPFESVPSVEVRRRLSILPSAKKPDVKPSITSLTPMWAAVAGNVINNNTQFEIGVAIHDSVYNTDFASVVLAYDTNGPDRNAQEIERYVLQTLRKFSVEHLCKFLGAGVTLSLLKESPNLCTRLWLDTDIIPFVFDVKPFHTESSTKLNFKKRLPGSRLASGVQTPTVYIESEHLRAASGLQAALSARLPIPRSVDEQADSAARKCLMYFGPGNNPRLTIGPRNQVLVDCGGKVHLIDNLEEYKRTVGPRTWNSVIKLADELRQKHIKIGFFSSTPQGGGVALMRHAVIRFLTALDVDAAWYVPNPSPSVFRTTKNNHNILQGVAPPDLRLTQESKDNFDAWILKNGLRWTAEGGPLAPGGLDIAFIDDPQMPGLIPLIKKLRPEMPIVYRSHIEIRSDLIEIPGSPQEEVWNYLWNNIQLADVFVSHPVNNFVPKNVPMEMVGLLNASTDWLDGLNKDIDPWDLQYYMGEFRSLCLHDKMDVLGWPHREYIIQVARFDPAKGIMNVIDSYYKFRQLLTKKSPRLPEDEHPQLLICGHGAVDDPDASLIYDQVIHHIQSAPYNRYRQDIVVMRLPPSDQLLNALMKNSKIALQLSIREGFEVKVSEALHAGKPVIASRTGGIPLQIVDGKSGFLTTAGDNEAVARHLYDLYTDKPLYEKMSQFAKTHVSDEVSTVGLTAAWLYLAVMLSRGVKVKPNGAWLFDMLREETGEAFVEGETRLPREGLVLQ
ncbi:hypothetical protein D9619_004710 [Psilocybe cf. subviscida]|uniref:Glycosyltransferase family 4 protein n=1 Tax=Psilocybe cf. subviscida TaxID=2480587 RepID=A0A8H5BT01_9AGAR|nr:hypothetical protein D9619_004710 [Psilocybe cf. subviscida]